jgi:hypothetical protein
MTIGLNVIFVLDFLASYRGSAANRFARAKARVEFQDLCMRSYGIAPGPQLSRYVRFCHSSGLSEGPHENAALRDSSDWCNMEAILIRQDFAAPNPLPPSK